MIVVLYYRVFDNECNKVFVYEIEQKENLFSIWKGGKNVRFWKIGKNTKENLPDLFYFCSYFKAFYHWVLIFYMMKGITPNGKFK